MSKIWVTSDLHFGHSKNFLWGPRGFSSSREHDIEVIRNWNSVVAEDDDVYLLGDLMLEDTDYGMKCVSQLNGRLHLVRGNHDSDMRWTGYNLLPNVVELCGWGTILKYRKYNFFLSHFPTRTANYDDEGLRKKLINLCGHTHTQDRFLEMDNNISYHVELDAHNNYPVLLDDIIEELKEQFSSM